MTPLGAVWVVVYVIVAIAAAVGLSYYVGREIRYTFFLPPVEGVVLYSEMYIWADCGRNNFFKRAHLVITEEEITISMCRLFYKYWPNMTSIRVIPRGAIVKITLADEKKCNLKITLPVNGEVATWRIGVKDVRALAHYLSRHIT